MVWDDYDQVLSGSEGVEEKLCAVCVTEESLSIVASGHCCTTEENLAVLVSFESLYFVFLSLKGDQS